jgi:transcriptional regulator with XRE-family HTH domain
MRDSVMKSNRIYPTLKAWRLGARLNQAEAARILGVSQGFYSKLESGKGYPDRRNAKAISEKAGVPLEPLLGL